MMKKLVNIAFAALLASAATADQVVVSGFGESAGGFTITRGERSIAAAPGILTRVQAGDAVRSAADRVLVRLPNSSLVAMNTETEAIIENGAVVLKDGDVIAGFPASQPIAIRMDGIEIVALPAEPATGVVPTQANDLGMALIAETPAADIVNFSVANGMAVVREVESGRKLVTLAAGEVAQLVRNAAGQWLVTPDVPFSMQGINLGPEMVAEEVAAKPMILGAWWWGAAAGAGGGYLLYEITDDDDPDGPDDERPPLSPR